MAASLNSFSPAKVQNLLDSPVSRPPPGQISDLNAPNPHLHSYTAEIAITTAISAVVVLVRLYTRHFVIHNLVAEDYVIVLAILTQAGAAANAALCVHAGAGKHAWNLTLRQGIEIQKYAFIYSAFYLACSAIIKIAILLQFIRIFAPSRINKPVWYACWTWGVINTLFYALNLLAEIFRCDPIDSSWNSLKSGHCLSLKALYQSSGMFCVISDFIILMIPIPVIFKLNMALKKKWAIATVFASGILACVASIMRTYYLFRLFGSTDSSYIILFVGVWCEIEMLAGVIIFCLPVLPKFYHALFGRLRHASPNHPELVDDASLAQIDREDVKPGRQTYEMPSLASFEVNEASNIPSTTQLVSMHRSRRHSSELSKASSQA